MVGAEGSSAKLPLWPTIRLSYASYLRHFGDVLRISAFWLALLAVFNGAMGWLQASWTAAVMASPSPHPALAEPVEITVLGNISNVAMALAAVSISVAWHRRLLLEEAPGRSGGNIVTDRLWRYIAVAIMVSMIAALPVLTVLLIIWMLGLMPASSDTIAPQTPFLIAALAAAYVAGVIILLRLCVLLPANATGNTELNVKGAWRLSRGNGWRLFWGIIACMLIPLF